MLYLPSRAPAPSHLLHAIIYGLLWPCGAGLTESVVTLDELTGGDDVRGTELEGLHREVLLRALRLLEQQGKAK